MADKERKKGGGSKLSRSETVTVRLDPRLRYLSELAARKQRRTLSSYIEWALEVSLKKVSIAEDGEGNDISVADEAEELWDVAAADRFVKLAFAHPELLTHSEQIIWKVIREDATLWTVHYDENSVCRWDVDSQSFNYELLRELWNIFKKIADGHMESDDLPSLIKKAKEH